MQGFKFKTRNEIADEYGICVRTLNKKLEDKAIIIGRGRISPASQLEIYRALGKPPFNGNKRGVITKTDVQS